VPHAEIQLRIEPNREPSGRNPGKRVEINDIKSRFKAPATGSYDSRRLVGSNRNVGIDLFDDATGR
jgi:hypothetical protein